MPSSGAPAAILDRLASLAAARGGILARRDLESCGFSANEIRGLVRSGALDHLHRDAYRVPAPDDGPWSRYPAAVRAATRSDPTRLLTGPAALTIHGLPTFGPQMAIHGGLDARGGSSRRSLISTVAMPPSEQRAVVEGVRVASPARAVLDTARLTTVVAGVMAADAALRRGLTTPEELGAVLATMRGLGGVARARVCCELADARSESPGESWSAVVMHEHGIPRPERQHDFYDARGFIGRGDFWWPEARVVGEFDGRMKYGRGNPSGRPPEDVLWDEKVREDRLRATGPTVVRWTTTDLRRPASWIGMLRARLSEGHERPRI